MFREFPKITDIVAPERNREVMKLLMNPNQKILIRKILRKVLIQKGLTSDRVQGSRVLKYLWRVPCTPTVMIKP